MSRWRIVVALCVLLAALEIVVPVDPAAAQEEAPPAADETLIYVFRVGRFVGGGAKMWVAVNDKTVARLENKGYAAVRVKAGAVTLNLASTGMVFAAIALDDRPGETVYLQWRLGDLVFEELDAEQGRALVADAEPGKPLDEELGNNEQTDALLNLSRLGFDLMRPAREKLTPDAEHAVITILRREEAPQLTFGIWSEDRYLGTLAANEALDVKVTPGEHFFLSGYVGTTLLRAQVEAGKHYYAWVDVGGMVLRVKMMPVTTQESVDLTKWLEKIEFVEVDSESMAAPRVREREATFTAWVDSVVTRAKAGTVDFTEIDSAHAF
jgi:hypothetical protein